MYIRVDCGSRKDQWFPDTAGLVLVEFILLCRAGNRMLMTVPILNMEYKYVFIIHGLIVALSVPTNCYQKDQGGRGKERR